MKIVGTVRTLNEDDIIEAVIRHHLAEMDYIIVLDDGSNDRTASIVKSLIDEGLPVKLIERRCLISDEVNRCTFLFELARDEHKADWVVMFDADEFIDMRLVDRSLREYLQNIPEHVEGVKVRLVNYIDAMSDNADEINVAKRMVWRYVTPHDVYKIILRARPGVSVAAGNHEGYREGHPLATMTEANIVYGHYFRRSGWHEIYKWVIGRLKVTAAGPREISKGTATHYVPGFETLLNNPGEFLNNPDFFHRRPDPNLMFSHPLAYLGGDLRYTSRTDYKMKCITTILRYSYELATEFGHLMDTNHDVQQRVAATLDDFHSS